MNCYLNMLSTNFTSNKKFYLYLEVFSKLILNVTAEYDPNLRMRDETFEEKCVNKSSTTCYYEFKIILVHFILPYKQ